MKFKLVAFEFDLYFAWKEHFEGVADVEIIDGDILRQDGDALVSPANSFGYMDGGLDLKISERLGWHVEERVRSVLESCYFGEIPVGNAIVVETDDEHIPFLISAPTMRVPSDVSRTVNAYLAFKAVIQAAIEHNQSSGRTIETILCPGLGTGEGRLAAVDCARQMRAAHSTCLSGGMLTGGGLAGAVRSHISLLGEDT